MIRRETLVCLVWCAVFLAAIVALAIALKGEWY